MPARSNHHLWDQLFKLSPDQDSSLQSQLREMVVAAILDRKIPLDRALPSSRHLAKQLGIARNTVVLAYEHLVDEGYLVSRERSGFFVNPEIFEGRADTEQPDGNQATDQPDWQRHFKHRPSMQRNIVKPKRWNQYPYPFLYGQLDPALFPINDWRDCCRQAQSVSAIEKITPDRFDADDPQLIEQIRSRILPRRGVWASSDEILVTLGAQQALFLISNLLMDNSSRVGLENPGYPDARNIFSLHSNNLQALEIDSQGVVPGETMNQCDCVYVTPSHQAPSTITMPMARRKEILENAEENDFILIEDDYESEINFVDQPSPALKSLDTKNRVIYIGSLSKTLAPGLRLGFMVAPPEVIEEARALRRLMIRHPPVNNQRLVALFLSLGYHDALINKLNQAYKERWKIMGQALGEYLPESSRVPSYGGTSYWVKSPSTMNSDELTLAVKEEGILIESGNIYFMGGEPHPNYFRLGYSSIATDKIEPGIRKLAEFINKNG